MSLLLQKASPREEERCVVRTRVDRVFEELARFVCSSDTAQEIGEIDQGRLIMRIDRQQFSVARLREVDLPVARAATARLKTASRDFGAS